jgi:hypothetical protein
LCFAGLLHQIERGIPGNWQASDTVNNTKAKSRNTLMVDSYGSSFLLRPSHNNTQKARSITLFNRSFSPQTPGSILHYKTSDDRASTGWRSQFPARKSRILKARQDLIYEKRGSEKNNEESVKRPFNGLPCAISRHPQQEIRQKKLFLACQSEKKLCSTVPEN